MKDVTINGHDVTLHDDSFEAGRFHASFVALMGYKLTGDFAHDIGPYCPFVESWGFAGDPQDVESWAKLGYIKELSPLMGEIGKIFRGKMEELDSALDEDSEKKV